MAKAPRVTPLLNSADDADVTSDFASADLDVGEDDVLERKPPARRKAKSRSGSRTGSNRKGGGARRRSADAKQSLKSAMSPRFVSLWRETVLVVLGVVALYLFIALATWSARDPGFSHTRNPENISNLGGRFGAVVADWMLSGFGMLAYLFPVLIGVAAWRLYTEGRAAVSSGMSRKLLAFGGFVLTMIGGCGLENLHFANTSAMLPFGAGGGLGSLAGHGLASQFGMVGGTLILLAAFVTGLTWFLQFSWLTLMDVIGAAVCTAFVWCVSRTQTLGDRIVGLRARKVRQEQVSEHRRKIADRDPPRIEEKQIKPKISERVEREKQSSLFPERTPTGSLPALSLLDPPAEQEGGYSKETLETMSRLIEKKLADFNIEVEVKEVHPGPVITRFEVEPAPGVKSSQLVNLQRDLARSMSLVSVRVVENIPGKTLIGIEIPNENRELVSLVEGLSSKDYEDASTPLALTLGKDIAGNPVIADLCKMPHLLIAGTTGAGKSVCINALTLSMIYKSTPEQIRLIMIDPKLLELSVYGDIPHLLAPVVTDMQEAANALRWCIVEMERRYKTMADLGVRNIAGYNRKVKMAIEDGKPIPDPLVQEGDDPRDLQTYPYIVVVIDELADLMMVVGKKVEELITRIAQRARAAGIHLVLATQRPSVDVITGLLKANIPTRIAFQVHSRADSRTILDQMGAEQLLGQGDMLFMPPGTGMPTRVHGAFVSDEEVQRVTDFLRASGSPEYEPTVLQGAPETGAGGDASGGDDGEQDPLYDQAVAFVTETRRASISAVQRRLRVGYNRAARLIESMENAGLVSPLESNGKREVLAPPPPEV